MSESFFWFEEEFPLQIALFEFQIDKDIIEPSMKIPAGTDGEEIESRLLLCLSCRNIESALKNGKKKRDYHNGVITKKEYVEWKL